MKNYNSVRYLSAVLRALRYWYSDVRVTQCEFFFIFYAVFRRTFLAPLWALPPSSTYGSVWLPGRWGSFTSRHSSEG